MEKFYLGNDKLIINKHPNIKSLIDFKRERFNKSPLREAAQLLGSVNCPFELCYPVWRLNNNWWECSFWDIYLPKSNLIIHPEELPIRNDYIVLITNYIPYTTVLKKLFTKQLLETKFKISELK